VSDLFVRAAKALVQCALLVLLLSAAGVFAATLRGEVVGLADGDTITVLDSGKRSIRVRLAGIDAPERSQAFGSRARHQLASMVFRKQVLVEYEKEDRYGRIVGKVMVEGLDVNLELIRDGLAWHYKAFANEQTLADQSAYAQAEKDAQRARRGLWAEKIRSLLGIFDA